MVSSTSAGRLGHHDPGYFQGTSVSCQATKVDSYLVPGTFTAYSQHSDNGKSWVHLYCKLKTASLGLKSLSKRADRELAAVYSDWQQQDQAVVWLRAQLAAFPCLDTSPYAERLLHEKIDADAALAVAAKSVRAGHSRKELASLYDERHDCERKRHTARNRLEELESRRAHAEEKARSRRGRHDTRKHIEPSRSTIRSARRKVANLDGDIAALDAWMAELQSQLDEKEAAMAPYLQAVDDLASRLRATGVSEQDETVIKPLMQRLGEAQERQYQLDWTLQQAEEPPQLCPETGEVIFFGQHSKAQLKDLLATVSEELHRTEDFIQREIKHLKLSRTFRTDRIRSTTFRPLSAVDFLPSQDVADVLAQDLDRGTHAWQAAIDETAEPDVVAESPDDAADSFEEDAHSDDEQASSHERDGPLSETALVSVPEPVANSDDSSETDDSDDAADTSEATRSDDERVSGGEREAPLLQRSPAPVPIVGNEASSEAEDSDSSVESSEESDRDGEPPDTVSVPDAGATGKAPLHDLPRPVAPAVSPPPPEPHTSRYHYRPEQVDGNWTRWPQERVERPLPPKEVSESDERHRGPLLLADRPFVEEHRPAAEPSRTAGGYAFSAAQLRQWGQDEAAYRAAPSSRPEPAPNPAAAQARQRTENPSQAKPAAGASRAKRAPEPPRAAPSSTPRTLPRDPRTPYTWSGEWHYLPRFMAEQLTVAVRKNMAWTTIRHPDPVFPEFGVLKDFYLVRENLRYCLEFRLNPQSAAEPITHVVQPGDARFHVLEILPPMVARAEPPPFYRRPGPDWRQPPSGARPMGGPNDPLHFYSTDPRSPRYRAPRATDERPRNPMPEAESWRQHTRRADGNRSDRTRAGASRDVPRARRAAPQTEGPRIDVPSITLRDSQGKRQSSVDLLGAALREHALSKLPATAGRSNEKDVLEAMQAIMDDASLFTRSAYPDAFASLANATAIIDELRAKGFNLRMLHELQEDLAYPRLKGDQVNKPAGFAQAFPGSDSDDDYRSYLRQKYRKVFSLDITHSIFGQMLGRIQHKLGQYITDLGAEALLEAVTRHHYSAAQKQSLRHDLILQRGEMTERAVDAVPAFKQQVEERVNEKLRVLERTDPDKVRTADHRRAQQDNLRKAVLAEEAAAMHDQYVQSSPHAELVLPVKSQFPANVWRTVVGKAIAELEKEHDAD